MNVLIFATGNLMGIARFPKALHDAGFQVGLLCSPESFISKTRYVDRKRFLKEYKPSFTFFQSLAKDLARMIEEFVPNLIIAGDERAVYCLHRIVRLAERGQLKFVSAKALSVIQFSLCNPQFYDATNNKNATQTIAKNLGIRVPQQFEIENAESAIAVAEKLGYPLVLKKGIGEAGLGVKVCQTESELLEYLNRSLFKHPNRFKQRIRSLLHKEVSWIPNNEALALQQFVSGTPTTHCVAAIEGKVLAAYTVIKEGIHPYPTGQATRIRFIAQPEIKAAIEKFVKHIHYTGFGDFDFLLESETGLPYFLECNPRPSALFHLGQAIERDLAQAMFAGLSNQIYSPAVSVHEKAIVLFPQEWLRDPQSPYLTEETHDVPWDDPLLLQAYLQQA